MLDQILAVDASLVEKRKIIGSLFGYLFRDINKYEYRAEMPSREYAKALWGRVTATSYVLLNCKLYVYARHCARREGRRVSASAFGIEKDDLKLLNSIELKIKKKYPALTLEQFATLENWVLTSPAVDLKTHMGKFISKKLIFLCRSYGLQREQITNQFLETSLYALRKQYPFFKSELHTVNVCKTAIHNAGISLIQYWTREKRNALRVEDDGTFSSVHLDIDVAQAMRESVMGQVGPQDDPHLQNLQVLRDLKHRVSPRARQFLDLARGEPDPGFSMFIGLNNDDAAHDWSYRRYLESVCRYLRVTETEAQRFLTFLRRRIA